MTTEPSGPPGQRRCEQDARLRHKREAARALPTGLAGIRLETVMSFVALAQTLSFSRAAARLFVSRSGLSRRIAALERDLGHRLFERSTRRVVLTHAGEAFLPAALKILAGSADGVQALARQGTAAAVSRDAAMPLQ